MTPRAGARWKPVALAFSAALAAGALGALITELGPWYYALRKPPWQPPDMLFGPVWTTIFALCAIAGVLAWRRAPDRAARTRMLIAFATNFVFNLLWSVLFFRAHRPDFALVEVAFLWASIATLMIVMWAYSRTSSLLLLPYLAWVTFASVLNLSIVRLNGPFGGG